MENSSKFKVHIVKVLWESSIQEKGLHKVSKTFPTLFSHFLKTFADATFKRREKLLLSNQNFEKIITNIWLTFNMAAMTNQWGSEKTLNYRLYSLGKFILFLFDFFWEQRCYFSAERKYFTTNLMYLLINRWTNRFLCTWRKPISCILSQSIG